MDLLEVDKILRRYKNKKVNWFGEIIDLDKICKNTKKKRHLKNKWFLKIKIKYIINEILI